MDGTELRARRQALGLSQVELAGRFGVSQTTITRWERGVPILHPVILDRAIRDLEREHEASRDAST
jgi:transcriptional regulator with XRE-family HTH domain